MKKLFTFFIALALLPYGNSFSFVYDRTSGPLQDTAVVSKRGYLFFAEQMPSFNGGDLATFRKWVAERVEYPVEMLQKRIDGTVTITFLVNEKGRITEIDELGSPHEKLSAAVIDVLINSPAWEPGKNGGEPVKVMLCMPVKFDLSMVADEEIERMINDAGVVKYSYDGRKYYEAQQVAEGTGIYHVPGIIQMPVFNKKAGLQEFRVDVQRKINYPSAAQERGEQGRVMVSFIVEDDGSLSNIHVIKEGKPDLENEVLRVVSRSPAWKSPGYMGEEAVRVKFTMPVEFVLH